MKRAFLTKTLLNQSGQGITEYILLLVVIVAIVFGSVYQLNTAFEKWANSYFGDYLSCLLETGELPTIGGAPGDSGICNQLFEPFDLANGRRFKAGAGGGTDGDGDGTGEDDSGRDKGSHGGSGGGVRETARGSGSGSGGGSSFSRYGAMNGSARGAQNISSTQKAKEKYTGSTASSMPAGVGYSQTNSKNGRPEYIAITGRRIVDIDDKGKAQNTSSGSVRRDPGSLKSEKRIQVMRKEISKDHQMDDEPMTFGGFLRFLLIAAIIIALVMFLGGQALQISKGSE